VSAETNENKVFRFAYAEPHPIFVKTKIWNLFEHYKRKTGTFSASRQKGKRGTYFLSFCPPRPPVVFIFRRPPHSKHKHANLAPHAITQKTAFCRKNDKTTDMPPPPPAKNRRTVSRKAFRAAFWHPVLVHPKRPNRDKKPVSGLLFPPYSPRKYRFYEFSHSIDWDSSSAFSQTIFISAHKNHIFCGHPAATKWKKGHFL